MTWGTPAEIETRRRILLTVCAYAYEFRNETLMPDGMFDDECRAVDLSIATTRPDLDRWWRREFDPSTGLWVRRHPELPRVAALYERLMGELL